MAVPTPTIALDEIIDFLASAPSAEEIIAYQPPEHLQARLHDLMQKNRTDTLTDAEDAELDEFLKMNRFMSRLQAKAKLALKNSQS